MYSVLYFFFMYYCKEVYVYLVFMRIYWCKFRVVEFVLVIIVNVNIYFDIIIKVKNKIIWIRRIKFVLSCLFKIVF